MYKLTIGLEKIDGFKGKVEVESDDLDRLLTVMTIGEHLQNLIDELCEPESFHPPTVTMSEPKLTNIQRRAILEGLGYEVNPCSWYDYVDHGHIPRDGFMLAHNNEMVGEFLLEAAAWNSIEFDPNFCFREIVPFMIERGFRVQYDGIKNFHAVTFMKRVGLSGDEAFEEYTARLATVEAAIQEAFLNYLQEQHP